MQPIRLFVFLGMALAFAACSAPAPTPIPPTTAPTIDVAGVQTQAAQAVFATQTASVPTMTPTLAATPTPKASLTPRPTNTPAATATPDLSKQIPLRGTYAHKYEIKSVYDKFKQRTEISLEPRFSETQRLPGSLVIIYSYPGETPAQPDTVEWGLISVSDTWEYLDCHSTIFLVDGATRFTPETQHDGEVGSSGFVVETVHGLWTLEEFLQVVNAQTVEGQLCNTEFSFSSEQMEALRDVASRMLP